MSPFTVFWIGATIAASMILLSLVSTMAAHVITKNAKSKSSIQHAVTWGLVFSSVTLVISFVAFWMSFFQSLPFVGAMIVLTIMFPNAVLATICFLMNICFIFRLYKNSESPLIASAHNGQQDKKYFLSYASSPTNDFKYSRVLWRLSLWCVPLLRCFVVLANARQRNFSQSLPGLLIISFVFFVSIAAVESLEDWNPLLILVVMINSSMFIGDIALAQFV